MELLENRIAAEGVVIGDDILKVDMFLNHQMDAALIDEMGKEFYRLFKDEKVDRILTVEASGIAIAVMAARYFGVPMVFAKKASHKNVGNDLYSVPCYSFTHGTTYNISVSKKYLPAGENVLIIDDFLADGNASNAMIKMIEEAGSTVCGIGIAVEKGFQPGGKSLRERGYKLQSLAIVDSMKDGKLTFRHQ